MANDNPVPPQAPTVAINWGALFKSPFFWGVVIGVAGTIVAQQQWKNRGRSAGLRDARREPRIVNPE